MVFKTITELFVLVPSLLGLKYELFQHWMVFKTITELFVLVPSLLYILFQHWMVFKTITELFVLVPSLLGLKGNLAMTLASRLSTEVSSIKSVTKLFKATKNVSMFKIYIFIYSKMSGMFASCAGM